MTNNNDIKLIAFDLDGTALRPETGTMSPKVEAALKHAHNKGIKTCCVTGRSRHMLGKLLLNSSWLDLQLTANGSCVYDAHTHNLIWSKAISKEARQALVEVCDFYNAGMMAMYADRSSLDKKKLNSWLKEDELARRSFNEGMDVLEKTFFKFDLYDSLYDEITNTDEDIFKIGIGTTTKETLDKILLELKTLDLPIESLAFSDTEGEITAKGVNKGNAIRHTCSKLNIDTTKVVTFGDSSNDYSMCNNEWKFVAMGNANDLIKQAADEICRPVTEDGVGLWIEDNIH